MTRRKRESAPLLHLHSTSSAAGMSRDRRQVPAGYPIIYRSAL